MKKLITPWIPSLLLTFALPVAAAKLNYESTAELPAKQSESSRSQATLKTETEVIRAALVEVGEMPILRSNQLTQYELEGLILRASKLSFNQNANKNLEAHLDLDTSKINAYFKAADTDQPIMMAFASLRQKQATIQKQWTDSADSNQVLSFKLQYAALENMEQGLRAYDQNNWAEADAKLTAALKIDKELTHAYNIRGRARIMLFQLAGALADFNQVLKRDPQNATAFFNRGYVLSLQKQPEAALNSFNQAIYNERDNALFYNNRATVHNQLGQYHLALEDLNRAVSLKNQESNYFRNRAKTWLYLKNKQNALADYDTALRLAPRELSYYLERGQLKSEMKDLLGALYDFTKVLFIDPENSDALYLRGQVYAALNVRHLALSDYNRAIKISPDSPYFERRGIAHRVELDQKRRLQDYTVLIQRHPQITGYYFERGAAYLYLKQPAKALADFERGFKLAEKEKKVEASYYFYRGLALRELNRCESAMADFKKACDMELKEACEHGCGPQPIAPPSEKAANSELAPPAAQPASDKIDDDLGE
jgi:tetratricopeptide (TPR) repeat protein